MSFLCNGVLCAHKAKDYYYTVTMPSNVTAQEGLCVLIPCTFTYEKTLEAAARPHGYWFIKGDKLHNKAVASTNMHIQILEEARDRFKLVGNLLQRDCSLSINDVKSLDARSYFFRYEHSWSSTIKYSYTEYPLRVMVVGLHDEPEINLPDRLIEGELVTVECAAPGRCSGTAPKITWSPKLHFNYPKTSSVSHIIGTKTYKSTITFTASRHHNNTRLHCTAYFRAVKASSSRSVLLNVEYPPAAPAITHFETEDGTQTPIVSLMVMQEGFDYTLYCTVDSNPFSSFTWKKSENILKKSADSSRTLQLTLLNVTSSDDGDYYCVARNIHGSNSSLVNVLVEYPPRTPKINAEDVTTPGINLVVTTPGWSVKEEKVSNKTVMAGQSLSIHCLVDSSPLASLTWTKEGETKLEKADIRILTLKLSNVTFKNGGQYWCVAKNKHGVANSSIFISVQEMESPNLPLVSLIGGVIAGAVVLVGVCLLALLMCGTVRRSRDANNEPSDKMETVDDGLVIYSAINRSPKGPRTENNSCSSSSAMDFKDNIYENFRKESLQYTSIHFSRAKPARKPSPLPEETLYSEVKVH
ncbi:hypothetical protein NDU88_010875 [Pleurodeles waltl]|uniref:Ig-like domain-containing protein n=2 Tax=Pleurodeles waltl TaxID=8319 RepID=A0AAV7PZ67_PLEWA|nr:hypothetical protein NDU88_010875 [Pleurodeles waltl]